VVWLADIAAYFFGRTFGKRKLAPSISPGKTWEGAIGGGVAVVVYGFMLAPQLPGKLSANYGLLLLVLIVLVAISIIGDLFESLLKRQAGLKDSSNVLPGHGGVLDRIDSLTSTLPLVALTWLSMVP
jgi:phosphatidate cytidylyltransferase